MHLFTNIIGAFVFDDKFSVIDKILFNDIGEYNNKEKFIDKLKNKHHNLKEPDENSEKKILAYFKNPEFFSSFYNKNIELTKVGLKNSVTSDSLLIKSINSIDEINKVINILAKVLREWYQLHNPEFSMATHEHEKFVEEILNNEKSELLQKLNIDPKDSIGADLSQENLEPIRSLAHQLYGLIKLREAQVEYSSLLMDELCPNLKAVCGIIVGAKLIEHAGSLKRLSEMPASTIQVLGAETALFRHMKTGSKMPKHGIIIGHSLIAKAPFKMHGRIARALSDKISIASRVDYFKGQFIGNKLKEELEKKFG